MKEESLGTNDANFVALLARARKDDRHAYGKDRDANRAILEWI
jgi:hypothetical protein